MQLQVAGGKGKMYSTLSLSVRPPCYSPTADSVLSTITAVD